MRLLPKTDFKYADSVLGGLALALVFTWILAYPEYGPLLSEIFGPKASTLGHVFILCHGCGLILLNFLPGAVRGHKKTTISAGALVFLLTCILTFIPAIDPFIVIGLLGFISAYLVLAWISGFLNEKAPVIAIGVAMAGANILLGLVTMAHFSAHSSLSIAAAVTGLGPLLGAFYVGSSYLSTGMPVAERLEIKKGDLGLIAIIIAFAAAAYFSGGLWFGVVIPVFYSRWPAIMGVDDLIYAAAIIGLVLYARKGSYVWIGPMALSLLGLGLVTSILGLERPAVIIITVILLASGLGATDLFYWLTLRSMAKIMSSGRVFGIGLGLSLFFITASGVALDRQLLPNPLSSPSAAVFGTCLLFLICPLLLWFTRPLSLYEQPAQVPDAAPESLRPEPEFPIFWNDLTGSEKRVYELVRQGHTDAEIAGELFISRHTVKFHVRNILRKCDVSNRKELLMKVHK
jgi:DNA-binding CsgD family transcriptional regulator